MRAIPASPRLVRVPPLQPSRSHSSCRATKNRPTSGRRCASAGPPYCRLSVMPTDEVPNQSPPLEAYNLFESDPALREGVAREGGGWAAGRLSDIGRLAGTSEVIAWGFQANAHPP